MRPNPMELFRGAVAAVELWIIFWGTSVKLVLTKKTYIIIGIDDEEKLISASGKNLLPS